MRHVRFLLCLGLVVMAFSLAWCEPRATVMVKMQDGTELATDYYLPESGGPAWPTVVIRTAYPKEIVGGAGAHFAREGFAGVVQDIRGLGKSQGAHNVFYTDGWREGFQDGAETIKWVKSQPWCNGKIGTYGESALGMSQVLLAPTTHDVACQVITVAPSSFYHYVSYHGGVWLKDLSELWLSAIGHTETIPLFKDRPRYDTFWQFYNAEAKAPEITEPAIHQGGWYDIFSQGTINNFATRQHFGGTGAKGNQKLIMRWATHNDDRTPDFKLKENRHSLNIGEMRSRFLAYWLKGEQNDIMTLPAVYYYVMGDDTDPNAPGMEWRTADDWPPFPTTETPYFLTPQGQLLTQSEVARFFQNRGSSDHETTQSFTYDPADPFPTWGGANLFLPAGPYDQRYVNKSRSDVLKFATEPLAEPVETTGKIKVHLFVSTDAPDTDFTAKYIDIYPTGDEREILMLDGIQRVKYRDSLEKPAQLLTSSEQVVELTIDLWSTSWIFNKGHRIGLQISSSNYPRFDKNPNTGDEHADSVTPRVAHNTVYMGKDHPSALLLPLKSASASSNGG